MTNRDRRNYQRIPVEMWVEEVRGADRYFQRSGNVSRGGIFLDGTIPHPRGTVVNLRFTLPGESEPLQVRGQIVGEPSADRLGMHVQFLDVADDSPLARRLEEFLARTGPGDGA